MDDQETLRLIDENLVWAHSIAGAYAESIRHVDVKDIKQEAGVALCKAADTYDPSRKVPFRAYAHTCITNRLDSLYRAGQKQAHEQTTLDTPALFDDVNDETHKDQIPSPGVDAAREAHRNEVRRALASGMAQLFPHLCCRHAHEQGPGHQVLQIAGDQTYPPPYAAKHSDVAESSNNAPGHLSHRTALANSGS